MDESRYGMVGWREFASNREAILAKYDIAKAQIASRPVKVDHGSVGEASLREWLKAFLPKKYDVTSGFVIPDIIAIEGYRLYHYDVIIYDGLNAPVLWTEANPDQAEQGKKRAIPAKYVRSVLEVKATFNSNSAREALQKLRELNQLEPYLPREFFCQVVFMELPLDLASQGRLLRHLIPEPPIVGFRGGLIMRCAINAVMSGEIHFGRIEDSAALQNSPELPLAADIDALDVYLTPEGACSVPPGAAVEMVSDGMSIWRVRKMFTSELCNGGVCVFLNWSANGFSRFALDMLHYLDGADPRLGKKYLFGQIFDRLKQRS
jgi:hypothetical protein